MTSSDKPACTPPDERPALAPSFYDPEPVHRGTPRVSRAGKRRAWVLVGIHVLVFLHLLHWQLRGETLSPLEPSEAMYTTARGVVNAGAILLGASLVSVLIFGRFFCGWACHLVALQDGCAWLLKKLGRRPRPLRSRALSWVPLAAGLYMFGFPLYVRWAEDFGWPDFGLHLTKKSFWETFPGFWLGFATFAFCGGVMVWFLGAKGFCTYACPYGGLFGVMDKLSPFRIRVTDACKGCGHCSAVCTSNVRVKDEVARFGMVVDSGCMKCLDCVSVCPENALHLGFGKPAVGARPRSKRRWRLPYSWGEELLLALLFGAALTVCAGLPREYYPWASALYGRMPLLFSLGLASGTAFLGLYLWKFFRSPTLTLQALVLRRDGKASRAGRIFLAVAAIWFGLFIHSAWIQTETWRANRAFEALPVAELAFAPDRETRLTDQNRGDIAAAKRHYENVRRWGLVGDLRVPTRLGSLALLEGDSERATRLMREAIAVDPEFAYSHADLAKILASRGRFAEAKASIEEALRLKPEEPEFTEVAKRILVRRAEQLARSGDFPAAIEVLEELETLTGPNPMLDAMLRQLRGQ